MNVVKSLLSSSIVLAGALLASMSAQAAPACGSVTPVERRIVEHANGDLESLRSYVWMTDIVHHVNMVDVRQHLDQWRATVDCRNQAAAAEQAARLAADEHAAEAAGVRVAAR